MRLDGHRLPAGLAHGVCRLPGGMLVGVEQNGHAIALCPEGRCTGRADPGLRAGHHHNGRASAIGCSAATG